jgi:regulatory protein SWI6
VIQDRIDAHTAQVRDLSTTQKNLSEQLEGIQSRLRARQERKQKVQNLRRAVKEMRERRKTPPTSEGLKLGDADKEFAAPPSTLQDGNTPQHQQGGEAEKRLLQSRLQAYNNLNSRLSAHLTSLRARDGELEAKYRRVIALCTGTKEEHVDAVLAQLVLAVESEGDPGQGAGGQDVGRVREFLRRVEMAV